MLWYGMAWHGMAWHGMYVYIHIYLYYDCMYVRRHVRMYYIVFILYIV